MLGPPPSPLFYSIVLQHFYSLSNGTPRGRPRPTTWAINIYIPRDPAPHPRTSFCHPPHPIDQGYASTDALVGRECRGRPHCRPRQTDRRRIRCLQSVTAASRAPPIYKKHTSLTIGARGSWLSVRSFPLIEGALLAVCSLEAEASEANLCPKFAPKS